MSMNPFDDRSGRSRHQKGRTIRRPGLGQDEAVPPGPGEPVQGRAMLERQPRRKKGVLSWLQGGKQDDGPRAKTRSARGAEGAERSGPRPVLATSSDPFAQEGDAVAYGDDFRTEGSSRRARRASGDGPPRRVRRRRTRPSANEPRDWDQTEDGGGQGAFEPSFAETPTSTRAYGDPQRLEPEAGTPNPSSPDGPAHEAPTYGPRDALESTSHASGAAGEGDVAAYGEAGDFETAPETERRQEPLPGFEASTDPRDNTAPAPVAEQGAFEPSDPAQPIDGQSSNRHPEDGLSASDGEAFEVPPLSPVASRSGPDAEFDPAPVTPLRAPGPARTPREGRKPEPGRPAKGKKGRKPPKGRRTRGRGIAMPGRKREARDVARASDSQGRPLSFLRTMIETPEGGDVSFRSPMRRGFLVILITFGLFGSWSVLAQIDSAVIAPGSLTVSGRSKEIQHLEGGIIRDILVKDGDFVDVGTPLVRLDGTRELAQYSISERRFDESRANVARLIAERDKQDTIDFPEDLLTRQSVPEIETLIKTQQQAFETRRSLHEGQISLLEQRKQQLQAEIQGLQSQAAANGRRERLLAEEISGLRELLSQGFAARNRVSALERELAEIQAERAGTLARIAQAQQGVTETNLRITQEISSYRDTVLEELEQWERQSFETGNEANMMADTLERTLITAPVSGTVVGLSINTEGAVIAPGAVLMEIVPDRDALLVEVRLRPQDIDSVTVNQRADVQLSAFSNRELGKIPGTVTYVSADRRDDERTGQPYFVAQVELDSASPELQGLTLTPGMPAEAFINTGSRTPFKYLVGPLTDSFGRAWREG